MRAARAVCWGFDLGEDDGYQILADHYNPRCEPPWPEADLRRKCAEAMDPNFSHPRGWLRDAEGVPHHQRSTTRTAAPQTTATPSPFPGRPLTLTSNGRIPHIRNYIVRPTENGGETRIGLTPQQIAADILAVTNGWPKACAGRLFIPDDDFTPRWLDDATALFGWLAGHVGQGGGLIEWGHGGSCQPKAEFFAHLAGAVEQFEDVQTFPHVPPRPGTYYMHPDLPEAGSGAFEELLSRLLPATPADRDLIRAFFLTLAWGGRLGARPVFIFESAQADGKPGQGSGKSTAAMLAGQLFGGFLSISLATADDLQVQTRLLSEAGLASRLVIFDNLKGTRVSSSLIESYVTSPVISGKRLYVGEGQRPNHITWVITANQPSLSRDFTQRSYPIRITPPRYSPEWNESTDAFIAAHRWQIIADILGELRADQRWRLDDGEWSRWPDWERDVLCRVCDPRTLAADVKERRGELDDDDATATTVRDALAKHIQARKQSDPETLHLILTPEVLVEALGKHSPHGPNPISLSRWLAAINIPGLKRTRSKERRFWVWKGIRPQVDEPIEWDEILP